MSGLASRPGVIDPHRARRLGWCLAGTVALSGLTLLGQVLSVSRATADGPVAAAAYGWLLPSGLLLIVSLGALVALRSGRREARALCLAAGVLTLALALLLARSWLGLMMPLLGMMLILLALPRDRAS